MIWDTLDKIGIILGFITAIPLVWSFIILITVERRRKGTFATILGAELTNKIPVILYQNDSTTTDSRQKYIEWGLLNRP